MTSYSLSRSHSELKEIFPNIFFVMGTNKVTYKGVDLQHSRNMIIIRNNKKLSLINTVRLDEKGLAALDKLGLVENIVRIGAFHGRDDAFYLEKYNATLWSIKGMKHGNGRLTDIELLVGSQMPFPGCSLFVFQTSVHPEAILHLNQEGGILITCDSIKNWLGPDEFFSAETAKLYEEQGFFGAATISEVWKEACKVKSSDFARLKAFSFRHLLSAHGAPLLNEAYEQVSKTIKKEFGI